MSELELEKTYLAKFLPDDLNKYPSIIIEDIYFESESPNSRMRLRRKGEKYELTKKSQVDANDASKQIEQTIELSRQEFELFATIANGNVSKQRFLYPYQSLTAEIDVFKKDLEGLVLVEFEFKNEEDYRNFVKPDFCLVDVTQEKFIAGSELAGKKYIDLEEKLREFNYKKI
jgi:CYTH domain-containing protein